MMATSNLFVALQSFGIITSFLIGAWTAWRMAQSTKVTNYLMLTQYHREIWSLTLGNKKYAKLRQRNPHLWHERISDDERQMMTFVLLHITCAYELSKSNNVISIEKLEEDINDLLEYPFFRRHWEETKHFYNNGFRNFMDKKTAEIKTGVQTANKNLRILIASDFPEKIIGTLANFEDEVQFHRSENGAIKMGQIQKKGIDLIICFGFSHIISDEVLESCRAINLHGGLLPWNRGPNPNLWSWIDDTPKGVTIHEIDSGIDSGPILTSKMVEMGSEITLQQSFDKILEELCVLFNENWVKIRNSDLVATPQNGKGSCHTFKDQEQISMLINNGLHLSMSENVKLMKQVLDRSAT